MKYIDRNGNVVFLKTRQDKLTQALYRAAAGRTLLAPLTAKPVSVLAGKILDTRASRVLIPRFVKKNNIELSDYESRHYLSFNDFFARRIKAGARPICAEQTALCSPADGKVSAYAMGKTPGFVIKNVPYSLQSLLRDKTLSREFADGYAVIIRLSVDDYHRYCWCADGKKSPDRRIAGVYHTVHPAACGTVPVYRENTREYCVLQSPVFGKLVQMEIGAMLVGKIVNLQKGACFVKKGQEKGRFEFGGSTILVLMQKQIRPREDLLANTKNGAETLILQGEVLAHKEIPKAKEPHEC